LGFGWYHEYKFCYAEFKYVTRLDETGTEETTVFKSLTREDIKSNVISYMRKQFDKLEEDPAVKPISFFIT